MRIPFCYSTTDLGTRIPTQCIATDAVLNSIREELARGGLITMGASDRRLALLMGLADGSHGSEAGFNDGVFYPTAVPRLLSQGPSAAPAAPAPRRQRKGTMHALALMVDFVDNPGTETKQHFASLLFDAANPKSMTSYYQDISCRQLTVTGEVTDWIRVPQPYSYYTNGNSGTGAYRQNSQGMLEDALKVFCSKDNLARFDADGDGYVDGIFLIHAGGGAEGEPNKTKRMNKVWSHKWTLPSPFINNGVSAYAYSTEPEDGNVGVFAHEFGHVLGLPDLYDTSYRSSGVGKWCLMGGGSWGNNGLDPVRLSCWCLKELGWIIPSNVQPGNLTLDTLANNRNECYQLSLTAREYFLLENREQTGRDSYLPGSGLAVWHIDETRKGNDNPPHYRVGLVQADGRQDLESNANIGDDADLFPGTAKVTSISDTTTPNLLSNVGVPSGRSISRINKNGRLVSARIT